MRYTVFVNAELKQFFFSTDHLQGIRAGQRTLPESWVPISGTLPHYVVPRPSVPDGVVDTLEKLIAVYHDGETEIPNPDPAFQPKTPEAAKK